MKILKWLKLSLLAVAASVTTFAMASCDLFGKKAQEDGFTGFLKGAQTEFEVGMEFNFKEFVDVVSDSDYVITISNDQGFSEDITRSKGEETDDWALGKYTITYEVIDGENKGTYTYEFELVAPRLKVFTTIGDEDMVMRLGQPLVFANYFAGLNLDVRCYKGEYTVSMQSVVIGDVPFGEADTREVISLEGQTSYTPTVAQPHYFTMKVVSLDGQVYTTLLPVRVAVVGDQVDALLASDDYKNMSIYGYTAITNDMGVSFRTGFTRASNARNDIGYVGFKGEYGKGTYVKVDFTGNNLPKVVFFTNPMVNGLTGGEKGLLLNNGTVRTTEDPGQGDCNQFGVYGPNKLSSASFNGSMNCLWSEANSMLAWNNLKNDPDRQYTYIVGVKDCKDASETSGVPYVVFEVVVLDRESEGVIYEKTIKVENKAFVAGYFKGNVQLFGAFGAEITFDKVYPLATGIESIDEMYESGPKFASTAKKTVSINQVLTVQEYIGDDLRSDAVFGYINVNDETAELFSYDNDGNKRINTAHPGFVNVTTESFSIETVGTYKFLYQIPEEKLPGRMTVVVSDPSLSDFENGENNVIASFGTYASDGKDGLITIAENVGADGNHALQGYMADSSKITALMNVNFNTEYLEQVFGGENSAADYITFDLLCDTPYLRFAREGGAYYDETYIDPDTGDYSAQWVYGNTYLVADANDVGFAEYTEKIEYNGQTLYRFSLIYRKAAWLRISNNGTISADKVLSTVAFDFSGEIDKSGAYLVNNEPTTQDKFNQVNANITVFYIDNVRTGKFEGKDITFENGQANGAFIVSKAGTTAGAVDVVKYGDDYALQMVTGVESAKSNSAAFGLEAEYLNQVFNVKGAKSLTFKAYYDPETIDAEKAEYAFLFNGHYVANGSNKYVYGQSAAFMKDAFDTTDNSVTYTITAELYHRYFDENGEFKTDSISTFKDNNATFTGVRLFMKLTKGGATVAKGTHVYFDDFLLSYKTPIAATIATTNVDTYYQGTVLNVAELKNALTINVTSHDSYTAEIVSVAVDGQTTDLTNVTELTLAQAGTYVFTVQISTPDESVRNMTVSVEVTRRVMHSGTLMVTDNMTGIYEVELGEQVSNVTVNGTQAPADKLTITATGLTIDKAYLAQYKGVVEVVFTRTSGEVAMATVLLVPPVIDFEDGGDYSSIVWVKANDATLLDLSVSDYEDGKAFGSASFASADEVYIYLHYDWMKAKFADTSVGAITFDIYTAKTPSYANLYLGTNNNWNVTLAGTSTQVTVNGTTMYKTPIVLSRALFNCLAEDEANARIRVRHKPITAFFIDNLETVAAPTAVDFETSSYTPLSQIGANGHANVHKQQIAAITLNGETTRVAYSDFEMSSSTIYWALDTVYLDAVFADASVTHLQFDIIAQWQNPASVNIQYMSGKNITIATGANAEAVTVTFGNMFADATLYRITVLLSREQYQEYREATGNALQFRYTGSAASSAIAFWDNFKGVTISE